jgi:integrase
VSSPQSAAFFLSDDGSALTYKKALWAFQYLRRKLGWVKNQGYQLPRLYDLRHSFVCRRLLMAPGRYRCPSGVAVVVDLSGARQGHRYLLVCDPDS